MDVKLFESFSNDVEEATACYVIWNRLQNAPASDDVLLAALNRTPLAWKVFRHTCVVALIVSLGRIFDTDDETASIYSLLRDCEKGGSNPPAQDEVICPTTTTMQTLRANSICQIRRKLRPIGRAVQTYLLPLRHKLIAHRETEYLGKEDELRAATAHVNVEEVLNFLTDVQEALDRAYLHGQALSLTGGEFDRDWFEKDINELLRTIRLAPAPPPAAPKIF